MKKSNSPSLSNFTNAKLFNKSLIASASAVLVLLLGLAAGQPAQADEAAAQMIDDSGLVISSNADGSLKEFHLSQEQLSALRIFQPSLLVGCSVLKQAADTQHPSGLGLTCTR
jgi:hypothetical protein